MNALIDLAHDLRYAVRSFRATPGLTVVAVLTIAIGIGSSTAIFTLVSAALIARPPFHDPDRLVALWEESARRPGQHNVVSPANFVRWQSSVQAFEPLAAYFDARATLSGGDLPEEVVVQRVTSAFFPTLGVAPAIGRVFSDVEQRDRQARVVVLGHALWQRRFGADPTIVGRAIAFNGVPTTVVGVMPEGFGLYLRAGALAGKPAELWAPYALPADASSIGARSLTVVARVRDGVVVRAAQAELTTIANALAEEFPDRNAGWSARVVSMRDEMSATDKPALQVLAGAVAFVLLIACANVAHLLLARGTARQRELAIRTALGASRGRIVRQLLADSLALSIGGAGLGLGVAWWCVRWLVRLNPIEFGPTVHASLDSGAMLFALAAVVVTTLISGVLPAIACTDFGSAVALAGASMVPRLRMTPGRLRNAFVISEIALAVALLAGAGLMIRSLRELQAVDPGFNPAGLLTFRLQLAPAKYSNLPSRVRFFQDVAAQARTLPGVHEAGAISFLPYSGSSTRTTFTIVGSDPPARGQEPVTEFYACDDGYFGAIGLPLHRGRLFTPTEAQAASNVAVVNAALARAYFGDADPIGRRLVIAAIRPSVPIVIVGVVGDMRAHTLSAGELPTVYWPHAQLANAAMSMVVRTASDPAALAPSMRRIVQSLDPDQPIADVRTMDDWIGRSLAQTRFTMSLLSAFAAIAVALAAIGIYGLVSHAVQQRTPEIGIRIALGATRRDIVRLIGGAMLKTGALGLAAGLLAAIASTRALSAWLYQVTPTDPLTLAGAVTLLAGVTAGATMIPSRRAMRIEPIESLRAS